MTKILTTSPTFSGNNRFNLLILPIALIVASQCVSAATYYVATNGNDSNPGTLAAPFQTLQQGTNRAAAGDTVIVRDGTYGHVNAVTGGDSANFAASPVVLYNSGTASAWITIKAEHKWAAVLDCEVTCDSYINLLNASYIVIQDFVITRGYHEGIHSNDAAHHITLRGNRIEFIGNRDSTYPYGQDGMYTNANCHDFVIDGNVIHDIGRTSNFTTSLDHGLYLHGSNYTITNNIFYNFPRGWAIQMADGLSNVVVANNTFSFPNPGQDGQIMMWNTQSNLTIQNNIFYNAQNYAIARYASSASSCAIDHNIVYGASGMMADSSGCSVGSNKIGMNPMFVNISSAPYDFHVQAGGPGIDAGVNNPTVTADFYGIARPQGSSADIGASESLAVLNPPVISGVFTSGVTTNSAYINWSTNVAATSVVQFGPGGYANTTPSNPTLVTQHTVALTSLSPSTLYHYHAGSQDSSGQLSYSADFTFTTATPPPSIFSLSGPAGAAVLPGGSTSSGISATLVSGSAVPVSFSASSLPAGVSASFSSPSCTATCGTTLTLSTSVVVLSGTYNIVVSGTGPANAASTTVALTVTLPVAVQAQDVLTGLAARWTFSEDNSNGVGQKAYDSSGNGNTGTMKGGANWATGSYGAALTLNGAAQYVAVPESSSLEMTSQLSVSFWLYANPNSSVDPRVISKAYDWDVKLNGSSRTPQFSSGGNYAMLNYSLPSKAWRHIVFTFSSGVVKGYVNGVPTAFLANTFTNQTLPSYAYGLNIGTDAGLSSSFAGLMDDVRIYNRALSASEASAIYAVTPH